MGLSSQLAPSAIARPGVCTSSTRPASPYEGQVIYTTDTDLLQIWNGTAWRTLAFGTPTNGTVLQVVNTTYSTLTDNSTTTYTDTGLSATITPTSTTSKILVVSSQFCFKASNHLANAVGLRIVRGSTTLLTYPYNLFTGTAIENYGTITMQYLDSPATTAATTYKMQFANNNATFVARVQADNQPSVMTLMEVAG